MSSKKAYEGYTVKSCIRHKYPGDFLNGTFEFFPEAKRRQCVLKTA